MNTHQKRLLYAGGICLVASEIINSLPNNESKRASGPDGEHSELQESENEDDILEYRSAEPRSFAVCVEEPPPMMKEQLEESLLRCDVLTDETASAGQPSEKGTLVFKPFTAVQQLKCLMAVYGADATYEDNFIYLSSSRLIFFHFLLVIWLFSRVEVTMKSLDSEVKDSRKCAYIAQCTRTYIFRKFPILHHFLPKGISVKTKTMCLVEDGVILRHQDRYMKLDLAWKRFVPCSKQEWKVYFGNAYTYVLRVFSFFFNLIAYMRTH